LIFDALEEEKEGLMKVLINVVIIDHPTVTEANSHNNDSSK